MTCTCAMQTGLIKATACAISQLAWQVQSLTSFVLSLDPGFPLSQAMVMPMPSSMLGVQQQCCLNYGVNDMLMFWALSSSSCFTYVHISLSFSVSLSLLLSLSCCYVFTLGLGCIDAASLSLLVLRSGSRIACSVWPSLPSLSSRCPWRTTCTGRGCNSHDTAGVADRLSSSSSDVISTSSSGSNLSTRMAFSWGFQGLVSKLLKWASCSHSLMTKAASGIRGSSWSLGSGLCLFACLHVSSQLNAVRCLVIDAGSLPMYANENLGRVKSDAI